MTTATEQYPRTSLYGMLFGRTPPAWLGAGSAALQVVVAGSAAPPLAVAGSAAPPLVAAGSAAPPLVAAGSGHAEPTTIPAAVPAMVPAAGSAGTIADASGARSESAGGVRRWLPRVVAAIVVTVLAVELAIGWPSLSAALGRLRAPQPGWLAAGLALEIAAMTSYAQMQRRLLTSAGVRAPLRRHLALAYAAHSMSVTLPGGAAFSTRFNYRQMRRFGARPAVASWAIAVGGLLSTGAFALISAASAIAANGTPQWRTLAALALAGLLLLLGIRWTAAHPDRLEPTARAALAAVNRVLRRPREHGLDQVRDFVDQLRAARLTPAHGAAALGHAILNWLFDAAALWMCLRAISDQPSSGTQVLLAFCAGMAAGSITVVPGGLGIIDNALVVGLVATGVPAATAIAAVVLYRLLTLGFIVGAGWLTWLAVREPKLRIAGPPADRLTAARIR
jgi:uncharacterized membrane protein YbhN (UPF0104 family)